MIATVDPDARHAHKTVHRRQDGFKAHLAIEPDTGIITDCALTKASRADNHEAMVGFGLLAGEDQPVRVLANSAYGSGELRADLVEPGHVDRVKPAPTPRAVPGGFTVDDFTVDHATGTATCPSGLRASNILTKDNPIQDDCFMSMHFVGLGPTICILKDHYGRATQYAAPR